jgi:hypothetical protein
MGQAVFIRRLEKAGSKRAMDSQTSLHNGAGQAINLAGDGFDPLVTLVSLVVHPTTLSLRYV